MSHSYSPLTKLLYVFAREEHRRFSKNAVPHPTTDLPDRPPAGGGLANAGAYDPALGGAKTQGIGAPEESWGAVMAIDPGTGTIKWQHKVLTPPWGGVTATGGNLVFGGTLEGMIFALNASTGERLWTFSSNGPVFASPISYLANGKQMVSIAAGDLIVTFGLD
jgi:outer membrane protein assembly factor BamB